MGKINLVKNGIFPITKDINGNQIKDSLDTGLSIAGTVQGEGKLLGTPCLFIRTSGCNLRCSWIGADGNGSPCDTPYSSHHPEKNMMSIDDIITIVQHNIGNMDYVVISGGEPTMQKDLAELAFRLSTMGLHVTIETNGTIFNKDLTNYVSLMSISPKLKSSTPWKDNLKGTGIEFNDKWANRHERDRKNIKVIQQYIDSGVDFQLKFVVSNPADILEIENDFLNKLDCWSPDDIVLMPEGTSSEMLQQRSKWAIAAAIERGWRFTPRLHIDLFGKARAV